MTTSSASVPHVTRSSSTPVASTTTSPSTVTCFSPVNPLVAAGLVPEDLSDILITPPVDAAVTKERTKRIVGARHLTADEYVQMVKDIENKKREAEELKEKKKAERDMKKAERERTQKEKLEHQAARKKEREEKKKQHEREKKKGKKRNHPTTAKVPRARRILRLESDDSDGSLTWSCRMLQNRSQWMTVHSLSRQKLEQVSQLVLVVVAYYRLVFVMMLVMMMEFCVTFASLRSLQGWLTTQYFG